MAEYPRLLHTAIDTTDAWALAEFYRQLLGLQYRRAMNLLQMALRTMRTGSSW